MSDIFISYAREDLERVRPLAQALEAQGWTVFWDRRIPAGKTWRQVIGKALDEARCVLVVWSRESVESDFVQEEADDGRQRGILVPVRIEDVRPPLGFRAIQGEDLFQPSLQLDKLLADIRAIIGRPGGHAKEEARPEDVPPRQPKRKPPRRREPPRTPEPGTVFRETLKDGSQGPEMVIVPAGSFEMGDVWGDGGDAEKPPHTVSVAKPFAIGKYPLTFEEYDRFAETAGRELPGDQGWGRGRRPVINVSWEDALAYAGWLSAQTGKRYRLPSEAEWEYAARSGGRKEKWAGTSDEAALGQHAWYESNSGGKTQPVGEKKPNGLGLCDMSGNVWEWVQDGWHESYEGAPGDGSAWESSEGGRRVVRGGSWNFNPRNVRSAYRGVDTPDYRNGGLGFRLAQDL